MVVNDNSGAVSSAVSRALTIPEVLGITLSFAEKSALAASSCVSTFWSDIAKTHLWKQMDTAIPLLELLAPMTPRPNKDRNGKSGHAWDYTSDGIDFKWDRIRRYGPYIKHLTLSDSTTFRGKKRSSIAERALIIIALTQPADLRLLPNIRDLVFILSDHPNLQKILPFVSSGLIDLELSFAPTTQNEEVCRFLRFVTHRTPNLECLKITTKSPVSATGQALAAFLRGTPELRAVTLPRFYHTSEVVSALAELGELENVETDVEVKQEFLEVATCFDVKPGGFPKLYSLDVEMPPARATQLLNATPSLSNLTNMGLSWERAWQRDEFLLFTETLGAVCTRLGSLHLKLFSKNQDATFPIKFKDIRPLLRCSHLHILDIGYDFPFILELNDIEEIGQAWPRLYKLALCSDPYPENISAGDGVIMEVLPLLATHCGELEELGLFFSDTARPAFNGILRPERQFNRLQLIYIGTSKVVLQRGVSIWSPAEDVDNAESEKNTAEWDTVEAVLENVICSKLKSLPEVRTK